jgi:hypothetical protein
LSDARIAGTSVTCGIVLGESLIDGNSKLIFSPNPVNNELKVVLPIHSSQEVLSVYNAQGTLVGVYEVAHKNELIINTSSYPQGVFFVKIGEVVDRFVKQ